MVFGTQPSTNGLSWPLVLSSVPRDLQNDRPVFVRFPEWGRLFMERPLPFLCVYRQPLHWDPGTEGIVTTAPSYAHLPTLGPNGSLLPPAAQLIQRISELMRQRFERFLLLEVAARYAEEPQAPEDRQALTVHAAPEAPELVDALTTALHEEKAFSDNFEIVSTDPSRVVPLLFEAPDGTSPNAPSPDETLFWMRLEISPSYQRPTTGEVLPLVLRSVIRNLTRALRRACFTFVTQRTNLELKTPAEAGRRLLASAELDIDREVVSLCRAFDFLLDVTPTNTHQAWLEFEQNGFQREPRFRYRHITFDPSSFKRRLYNLRIEDVEDPDLAELFREHREELAQKLTLIEQRGTEDFVHGSLQLYGDVDDALLRLSEGLLAGLKPSLETSGQSTETIDAEQFAALARSEIQRYRDAHPAMAARVEISTSVDGLICAHGNLFVDARKTFSPHAANALIQHEVGTHLVTFYNGMAQPLQVLAIGLAGYEELQEGLAVIAEYLAGGLTARRLRLLAGRVFAVKSLTNGASFLETFRSLRERGFSGRNAFSIATRVFRGGGLTKDLIYLRGLVKLLEYFRRGKPIETLFVGKVAAHHTRLLCELEQRKLLRSAPLKPRFLQGGPAETRLRLLRNGLSVFDLIARRPS